MTQSEYKEWYKDVDFIQDNMQFYSFNDFVNNCLGIKRLYCGLKRQGKKLFQWYIFAGTLRYNQKMIIWNYLNDWIDYPELLKHASIERNYKYYSNVLEQRNPNE